MVLVFEALFIFLCRVVDVSLGTVRLLLLFRGKRLQASVVGFFEVLVFINALGRVVNNLDSPVKLLAYAAGFATGNFVGSKLEERLALGYQTVHAVLPQNCADKLTCRLREAGFGATVVSASGREGQHSMVMVTLQRKALPAALALIETETPDAFVTILDTRQRRGGVFEYR
ncbi:MAG: DUF2179 domain-containing protein [Firmicutes bacterium]|nr:DUF2179 domain-containing protein [Bacillota bacterium]